MTCSEHCGKQQIDGSGLFSSGCELLSRTTLHCYTCQSLRCSICEITTSQEFCSGTESESKPNYSSTLGWSKPKRCFTRFCAPLTDQATRFKRFSSLGGLSQLIAWTQPELRSKTRISDFPVHAAMFMNRGIGPIQTRHPGWLHKQLCSSPIKIRAWAGVAAEGSS